jgi:hypothetical protein
MTTIWEKTHRKAVCYRCHRDFQFLGKGRVPKYCGPRRPNLPGEAKGATVEYARCYDAPTHCRCGTDEHLPNSPTARCPRCICGKCKDIRKPIDWAEAKLAMEADPMDSPWYAK